MDEITKKRMARYRELQEAQEAYLLMSSICEVEARKAEMQGLKITGSGFTAMKTGLITWYEPFRQELENLDISDEEFTEQ